MVLKITSKDIVEKTLITFHVSNVVLQQQYQECRHSQCSELITTFLVVEKNNELLMKNHKLRPTSSQPFPKANANIYINS